MNPTTRHSIPTLITLVVAALLLAGCQSDRAVPTAASLDAIQTEVFATENAPPPAFQSGVKVDPVDSGLGRLSAWHYVVTLRFEGVNAANNRNVTGLITAEVFSNELARERRVILKADGEAFGVSTVRNAEAVRIGDKYYLVNETNVCAPVTDAASKSIADLTAGGLIGGVRDAQYSWNRKTTNGFSTWEYAFTPGSVNPPPIELKEGGKITIASGNLWIAPVPGVVVQYQITFNVQNVVIQGSQPVSGQLRVTYDLRETGTLNNISIPFGC